LTGFFSKKTKKFEGKGANPRRRALKKVFFPGIADPTGRALGFSNPQSSGDEKDFFLLVSPRFKIRASVSLD